MPLGQNDFSVLLQAFTQAIQEGDQNGGLLDPVKNVYSDGNNILDHNNLFDFLENSGYSQDTINKYNIQTAATLYAIMILGDEMGIFRVADAILKYVTIGRVDVESSSIATRLYNYMKLRDERTTAQERAMFYQQVFNLGQGQTMDQMSLNNNFVPLWDSLMQESVRYIRTYERVDNPELVSKFGVRQAILNLQHNLSRAASGMVKIYVPEMYAHLQDAIQIISSEELRDQLGHGVSRDLWNVVESVSMEEFNYYPNTASLRTVASSARAVMLSIAEFTDASFDNTQFQQLINNVEAFIIAKGQMDEGRQMYLNGNQNGYSDNDYETDEINAELETMDEDWDF
ncbi:MAG TPA: hypothetical protein VJ953_21690 [Saprospiraceae bacterium]|nr:hypothetical protein [Saprospiraceae bacterium]